MTSVFSYMFDNLTGLNDDAVGITEKELQSQNHNNWTTTNHFKNQPVTGAPVKFATSQPNVFLNKGPSGSLTGSEVDVESNLLMSNNIISLTELFILYPGLTEKLAKSCFPINKFAAFCIASIFNFLPS